MNLECGRCEGALRIVDQWMIVDDTKDKEGVSPSVCTQPLRTCKQQRQKSLQPSSLTYNGDYM